MREKWDGIREHESPQLRTLKEAELIKSVYDQDKEWDEDKDDS